MSRVNIEMNGVRPEIRVGDFVDLCGNWYMVANVEGKYTFVSLESGFMYTKCRNTTEDLQLYMEKNYQTKFIEGTTLHRTENVAMTLGIKEGK